MSYDLHAMKAKQNQDIFNAGRTQQIAFNHSVEVAQTDELDDSDFDPKNISELDKLQTYAQKMRVKPTR